MANFMQKMEVKELSKLVIAEKPSVGLALAKVIGAYQRQDGYMEGNGYLVSWCVGHLVGLAQPDVYDEKYKKWRRDCLPIIPEQWKWEVADDKRAQFKILKELMFRKDVDELICATDAGREGELIFRLVYHQAGCKKPFKRLWISSMEDEAIKEGFDNLKEGSDYDNLYEAALCRSQADWLVGINGTRLFTTLYNKRLTVGRVQTPTLAMVVERNKQIAEFQKQKYFNLHLKDDKFVVHKEKIFDEQEANRIQKKCNGANAVVKSVVKTEKNVNPPKLYDLTTLQRESNRYFGYTAQKTLDITQKLYEQKLVTYPRTDSQYLTEDMKETAESMVLAAQMAFDFGTFPPRNYDVSRVINNGKVTDHHAIIPTAEIQKQDISELSQEERDILMLIAQRLLCATGEKQKISETEVKVECEGEEFQAKGKMVLDMGWKSYEMEFRSRLKSKQKADEKDVVIPLVAEGDVLEHVEVSVTEHFTSPPKPYTEDTLLSAMETAGNEDFDEDTDKKGLGTPATRASMIEKLVSSRYLERKGKQLIPTEAGINLIDVLPEKVKSAKMTAEWENSLMEMEHGKIGKAEFLENINAWVHQLVADYGEVSEEEKQRFSSEKKEREQIGICPRCGSPVYEGEKNFYCSNRECKFCIWKETKWLSGMKKKVTKKMAVSLLAKGRVSVTGLYSQKTGRNFDADLVLEDTGEYVNFKLDFNNKKKG